MANILVIFPQICYIEFFDITNPRYNEQISPVPWHFVKSRFHRITIRSIITRPEKNGGHFKGRTIRKNRVVVGRGGGGGGCQNFLVQEFFLRTNLSAGFFFSGLQALHEFFFSYR